jgi:hypothetical protein
MRRSGCEYPPILNQEELEEAKDTIATAKKLTPLGKVELRVSAWSRGNSRAFKRACPTSNHCYQTGGLTKACERLVGPRKSVQEIKKGHGSA